MLIKLSYNLEAPFFKDTLKAYFSQRLTTTSSRLFDLFQIDTCALLLDVSNGCSLDQLKK